MVATSSPAATRRKSVAVAGPSQQPHPGRRRRVHSIAPGDHLSPGSKARRSLVPRKSILKASINFPDDTDDGTQSMELTREYRADLHDNTTRKSFGRRVSFANHAHVRLFEVPEHNTNSTGTPQSSPAQEAESPSKRPQNDENAYPGAGAFRRRSSTRRSLAFSDGEGEASMDMDLDSSGLGPAAFFDRGEDPISDDFEDEDEDFLGADEDMEITEAIQQSILRKRSLSLGRQPLANLGTHDEPGSPEPLEEQDDLQPEQEEQPPEEEPSYLEGDSGQSQSFVSEGGDTDSGSQPMEFTVPLDKPPPPPSEAWLALRSVTHSGDTPYEPPQSDDDGEQEMDLTSAVSRLQAARDSMGMGANDGQQDDSFTSTEDSFQGNEEPEAASEGNYTINVTQLMRRVSIGPGQSEGGNSTMDISGTYDALAASEDIEGEEGEVGIDESTSAASPEASQSALSPQDKPTAPQEPRPNVFSAPSASSGSQTRPPNTTAPKPFNFSTRSPAPPSPAKPTSRPTSPTKPTSRPASPVKPTFSAAFAPPVNRPTPKKRTASDALDARLSPAKKSTGPSKLTASTPSQSQRTPSTSPVKRPAPVSAQPTPNKQAEREGSTIPGTADTQNARRSTGFRRPSGYFAQRKSLGGASLTPAAASKPSPAKKPSIAAGRQSVGFTGDGDTSAWMRFDATAEKEVVQRQTPEAEQPPAEELPAEEDEPMPAEEPPAEESSQSLRSSLPATPELSAQRSPATKRRPSRTPIAKPIAANDEEPEQPEAPASGSAEEWREGVEDAEEDDGPQISIAEFMELTGIRFMDEITAPRRSTIHPSAHRPPRRSSTEMEIPLAEYVVAMAIDVPQLELYTHVSRDLQTTIERIKTIYTEAEAEAAKMTPELFMEFLNADEDGQAELLHQLKLIKVHNHGQAKSGWYDWKLKWVEQLFQKADEGFTHLEADARTLEEFTRDAQQIVPGLREEYEQIMRELEQDQADIAELENCDQDYLNELKTTINEQTASLELFRGDVEESKSKLAHLQSRMDDINAQKQEQTTAIQDAEYQLNKQKNNTRAEVLRLQDELTALQTLHTWKASKIAPDMFEFIYASTYRVSVPCVKFRPLVNDVEIIRLDEAKTKYKDPFPALSPLSLDTARRLVHTLDKDVGVRQIVELLGDYWTSCAQIRSQLRQVAIKYPVTIDAPPSGAPSETSPVFTATATLMFPSVRGKATVSFIFNTRTVQSWPMSIASLGCDVKVCYGAMDRHTLHNAILGRLGQATPSDNYACLLDACMDAMDCYV